MKRTGGVVESSANWTEPTTVVLIPLSLTHHAVVKNVETPQFSGTPTSPVNSNNF